MKLHNAISLLELQSFLRDNNLSISGVQFVVSASAWKVTFRKEGFWSECSGLGRDIGEALANAFERSKEVFS